MSKVSGCYLKNFPFTVLKKVNSTIVDMVSHLFPKPIKNNKDKPQMISHTIP